MSVTLPTQEVVFLPGTKRWDAWGGEKWSLRECQVRGMPENGWAAGTGGISRDTSGPPQNTSEPELPPPLQPSSSPLLLTQGLCPCWYMEGCSHPHGLRKAVFQDACGLLAAGTSGKEKEAWLCKRNLQVWMMMVNFTCPLDWVGHEVLRYLVKRYSGHFCESTFG